MMPVKKKREKRPVHSDVMKNYLLSGVEPKDGAGWFELNSPLFPVDVAWEDLSEELLAEWIKEHPGSRPYGWWEFSAPRWERKFGTCIDGTLPEPRQRLGGIGTPAYEGLAYVPSFTRGVPDSWMDKRLVEYYNGRAKDIHGNPIGTEYEEGTFPFKEIDPKDPPHFESEASYLKRHNLFLLGEEKRLTAADFEPVKIGC